MLDQFLAGLLAALPSGSSLVLSSDHGNFEDSSSRMHTRNPVPLLVWGRDRDRLLERIDDMPDVTPALVSS